MKTIVQIVFALVVVALLVLVGVKIVTGVGDHRYRGVGSETSSQTTSSVSRAPVTAPKKATRITPRPRVRSAPAPSSGGRKFGFARASGQYQRVDVVATVSNPGDLVAKVSSAPKQDVTLDYSIVCSRTGGKAVTSMGQETARTPVAFALKKPEGNLKRCFVSTSGQLTKEGRMKTTLIG